MLNPSLYGRLCTEIAYVRSPLMCGLGAYVFDALMYRAAYVLRRLCAEPLMCLRPYVQSGLMCGLGAYVFDAESAYVRASYVLRRLIH